MINSVPKVMISYSHDDSAAVAEITRILDEGGLEYFLDEKDIEYAEDISDRVEDGIRGCTHIFVYVSPASLKSPWVLMEIGMARALRKTLVCYLSHPRIDLPMVINRVKYITNLPELKRFVQRLADYVDPLIATMSPVEQLASDKLYHFRGGWAKAIRLFGADDDLIPRSRVKIRYTHMPLVPPPELVEIREETIRSKRERTSASGQVFFNGPNTRLTGWRASPDDKYGAVRELNTLELDLAPVGWHDFEGLNEAFRETLTGPGSVRPFEAYVGLSNLLANGDVGKARLSNILDNAITLLTSDGYAAYQIRGLRVSAVPGSLSSAVAENTNRYLDEVDRDVPDRRVHSLSELQEVEESTLTNDYRPAGVPHPFAAAERGIAWELSPRVLSHIERDRLFLTGLSFDLEALHPDALYLAALRISSVELLRICRDEPGKEWYEGRLKFVPADLDDAETQHILGLPTWVPGGKASIIRALEVVRAIRADRHSGIRDAIASIAEETGL